MTKELNLDFDIFLNRVHPDDRETVKKNINEAFQTKKFKDYFHRIKLDDGSERIMQARGEVIADAEGNVVRMLGTGQDVTEQQKVQQELIEKTVRLQETNDELQRFAYVASNDLQEPLRKILTFSSLLEKEQLSDRASEYVGKMINTSQRMQHLIDDILQFSNLRSEHRTYETTDVATILKEVISDLEISIQNAKAQVQLPTQLPTIEAIPSQLGQLFQNLISNAIKFKKENETPIVSISASKINGALVKEPFEDAGKGKPFWHQEQFVKIAITDNGIGFDEANAEKIFEVFQRLHNRKSYEGTGIGLAICKRIVDNHHGFIKAKSAVGNGATFTIILPISQKHYQQKSGSLNRFFVEL